MAGTGPEDGAGTHPGTGWFIAAGMLVVAGVLGIVNDLTFSYGLIALAAMMAIFGFTRST